MGGESACRPGSVLPLARGGDHPSRTAVADSLVRSTREHRAGRPQSLAQGTAGSPLDLAPGGVYRAAAVTCCAGGLLHRRFTLTPHTRRGAVCFLWHCPAGHPGVGVTDHPALWSPDLPHRTCARRDRPADSPMIRIRRMPPTRRSKPIWCPRASLGAPEDKGVLRRTQAPLTGPGIWLVRSSRGPSS